QKDIDTITAWVEGGAKEGNPKDMPPAPKYAGGWTIGKPDLIIPLPEEFTLAASGPDEYQYFEVDPGFAEDKYVQMAEARPDNRKIVHHIIAFVQPPQKGAQGNRKFSKEEIEKYREKMEKESIFHRDGFLMRMKPDTPVYDDGCSLPSGGGSQRRDGSSDGDSTEMGMLLAGFAPGMNPGIFEPGAVKKVPAGSKIIFQMHYSKAAGSVQKDRSMIGLIFAKGPVTRTVQTMPIMNQRIVIPAGDGNYEAASCFTFSRDVTLLDFMPHMHLRGKDFTYNVVMPDGKTEKLLSVPRYDFAWQTSYKLAGPLNLPKGARIDCTAHFDNSARNKANPDPSK
ncbi:MAG: hypothetical protein ACRD3R_17575, partial [Terriglobales bacterium]